MHSEATKLKMREAALVSGRRPPRSPTFEERMRGWVKRRLHGLHEVSRETRNKISETLRAKKMVGRSKGLENFINKMSEDERREICRRSRLGKTDSDEVRRKKSIARKGWKDSPETLKRKSEYWCAHKELCVEHGRLAAKGLRGRSSKRIFWYECGDRKVKMRSSWEVEAARIFDGEGLCWEYEPIMFVCRNGSLYYPDFYLLGLGIYVEIKGWMSKTSERKIAEFSENNELLVVRDVQKLRGLLQQRRGVALPLQKNGE